MRGGLPRGEGGEWLLESRRHRDLLSIEWERLGIIIL